MKQLFIFALGLASPLHVAADPASYDAQIIRSLPHEGAPFTQGLELVDHSRLIETSGAYPEGTESFIRMIDLKDGSVLQTTKSGLAGRFAEDVAPTATGWLVATYHDGKAVRFNADLSVESEVDYPIEEGWGLCRDSQEDRYFATNGTEFLMELDSETLALKRVAPVTCMGYKVPGLNELEFVADFNGKGPTVFGNLYKTRFVLGIDPSTFECTSVFDLEGFGEQDPQEEYGFHVANGIAYLPGSKTFLVTGKNWQNMFEISLEAAGNTHREKLRKKLRHFASQTASFLATGMRSQIPALPSTDVRGKLRVTRREPERAIAPDESHSPEA
ncbi:QCT [Symbiodinium natans]|uniref:QCT protein n=1 Tax=Symbiodinium natans TaxID=878477 RepID=A0A812R6R3_9DINO|nr:QCT [Symbiodinium natans]